MPCSGVKDGTGVDRCAEDLSTVLPRQFLQVPACARWYCHRAARLGLKGQAGEHLQHGSPVYPPSPLVQEEEGLSACTNDGTDPRVKPFHVLG